MEQLKILEIINRWGYLNKEQISLLLNKHTEAVKTLLRNLTAKNIYMLSSLGNNKLGQGNNYTKINYNELAHQDLLIKWISQQNDILSYQTEKELKVESYREKDYPDLLVHYENKDIIIELERTRKSKEQFKLKLNNLRSYLLQDIHILWLVPNESMLKFVNEKIINYKWKSDFHNIEINTI